MVYLPKDYKVLYPEEKKNKYGAKKTTVNNIMFDSKKEAARYGELKLQQHCRLISKLQIQPRFDIKIGSKYIAFYKADFRYIKDGSEIIEDVKSKITAKNPVYRLKKKLVEALYNITILET